MDSFLEAELFRHGWLWGSALGSVYEDSERTHREGPSFLRLWLLAFSREGRLGDVVSCEGEVSCPWLGTEHMALSLCLGGLFRKE